MDQGVSRVPIVRAVSGQLGEEGVRNALGDLMAIGFLVELLVADYLQRSPEALRDELVEAIRSAGKETSQLAGLAPNEEAAELLADITVRMHDALDGYLDRALERLAAARAHARP
jgi:hypothetical protein